MKKILFWLPAIFCAFISYIALFSSIGAEPTMWNITFLAFLPMCFYFVGDILWKMNKEILELRQQFKKLEDKD